MCSFGKAACGDSERLCCGVVRLRWLCGELEMVQVSIRDPEARWGCTAKIRPDSSARRRFAALPVPEPPTRHMHNYFTSKKGSTTPCLNTGSPFHDQTYWPRFGVRLSWPRPFLGGLSPSVVYVEPEDFFDNTMKPVPLW